ncbi:MAG: ABC transporter ATP-binding protein [Rhodothermales bacterium]|nr:ABC transporter ATP-binding protein [Rhodothermales bacterium]
MIRYQNREINKFKTISALEAHNLVKSYNRGADRVLDGIDIVVPEGCLFSVLGSSGCGKTTLLRLLAGLDTPDSGTILVDGKVVTGPGTFVPPEERNIGYVFQEFALFPHLDVRSNIDFGLRQMESARRADRVAEVMDLLDLTDLATRMPHSLSGGEQQRVAVARSIAPFPRVLLMDEPFSSLDASLRQETRHQIRRVLKNQDITTILVTHDQEEALSVADTIAILSRNGIEQVGTPESVYYRPASEFVARFLGRTNLIESVSHGNTATTKIGVLSIDRQVTGNVVLSIRPEHLSLRKPGSSASEVVGRVVTREFKGHDITFEVMVDSTPFLVHTDNQVQFSPGDEVVVYAVQPAVVLNS